MNSPSEVAALKALGVLAACSVAVLGFSLWRLCRRGGRVKTDHFYLRDLVIAIGFAVFFAVFGILGFFTPEEAHPVPLTVNMMLVGVGLNVFVAIGLGTVLAFRKGSVVDFLGLRAASPLRILGSALLFLVSAYPGLMLLALLMKSFAHVSDEQMLVRLFRDEARVGHVGGTFMIFVSAALVAPLVEEFVFRGYLYGSLKRFAGVPAAAFVTSALFAVIHVNLSSLPALFYLALCLIVAYEWTGSLLVPIVMHALFNTTSLVGLYLSARSS